MSNEVSVVPNSEVLDPILTQICNMDLSKKDVLEILEVETLQEIEQEEKVIKDKSKVLEKLRSSLEDEMHIEDEKERKSIITFFQSKIDPMFGELKFRMNLNFVYAKDEKGRDNYDSPIEVIASVSGSNSMLIIGGCNSIPHKTSKAYQKKVIALYKQEKELNRQIEDQHKIMYEIEKRKKNLPETLKEFSAELSKRALDSTEKGKGVMSILRAIRAKSAPQQIECTIVTKKSKKS